MRRFKHSLLAVLLAAAALAQTASDRQGVDVFRVGARIACKCGACSSTLASCNMLECGFGKPAKERVFKMQHSGMTDAAIIDVFVKEYPDIYRPEPNAYGRLIPYLMLIPGFLFIVWFMRRYYRKPAPAGAPPEVESEDLARYKTQIEKDLAQLD